MKYIKEQQSSECSSTEVKKNKQKTEWKQKESNALKTLVKRFKGCRINWNQVAKKLQELFDDEHHFTPKACKDRYNHYLKEGLNFLDLTEKEIQQMIQLIKIYGNQWSIIAKQMQNRTEQFIKNKFYALVKKVLRTLYQIVFKKRNSSFVTNNIKPHIIAKYLCGNEEDESITLNQKQIRILAQELVFNNLKITKQSVLRKADEDELFYVLEFMKNENDVYLFQYKRATNRKVQTQQDLSGFSMAQYKNFPENKNYAIATSHFINNNPYNPACSNLMPSLSYMQK